MRTASGKPCTSIWLRTSHAVNAVVTTSSMHNSQLYFLPDVFWICVSIPKVCTYVRATCEHKLRTPRALLLPTVALASAEHFSNVLVTSSH